MNLEPIGTLHSCFKEKFGIPRQPGLVPAARASLVLWPPYNVAEALVGLESFSHVWLIYAFHAIEKRKWQPTVRPPRLGGNRRVGVFASRSNFRPNPIGLSVLKLEKIVREGKRLTLELSGADLLDGTPVFDIKPYLPYADGIADARGGYASNAPEAAFSVAFSPQARAACKQLEAGTTPGITALLEQMLALDPRPAYTGRNNPDRIYGTRVYDVDVRWKVATDRVVVVEVCHPGFEDPVTIDP